MEEWIKNTGVSVSICSAFLPVVSIALIDWILNAKKYRPICHVSSTRKHLICDSFICQHVNDPKHGANVMNSYLEKKTTEKKLMKQSWNGLHRVQIWILQAIWDSPGEKQKDGR